MILLHAASALHTLSSSFFVQVFLGDVCSQVRGVVFFRLLLSVFEFDSVFGVHVDVDACTFV